METTVGQIVINESLPEDMRDYSRVWDKKTSGKVLTDIAKRYPDKYKDIAHDLVQFGERSAYLTGGESFSLKDIAPTQQSRLMRDSLNKETQSILARAYAQGKTSMDPSVQKAIVDASAKWIPKTIEATNTESTMDNGLFRQTQGPGVAKGTSYNSIRGADILYVDQDNKPVPIPVLHGYSFGLRPVEYFAGSFGARKGVVDLQNATRDAGYLSKQLVQIAHRLVVIDDDSDDKFDENNPVGMPSSVDDPDNEGSMLARATGGYPRNTMLTPKILADLKKRGINNILVRSVIAGGPANGGVYAYDAGVREKGDLPNVGDFVGINAVQSISEPITQSAISCLDPETEVRMADGTVKYIKDIVVGDMVLGSNKQGYCRPVKVLHVFDNGIQPVYESSFKSCDGRTVTLRSTLNHKILCSFADSDPEVDIVGSERTQLYAVLTNGPETTLPVVGYHKMRLYCQVYISKLQTYDIEVDHPDHLFVLANGMVVSNSKHSGGVIGAAAGKSISGFKYLNQMIQVPKHFPGGATHSSVTGVVQSIRNAPQGGKYVAIDGKEHYVGLNRGEEIPLKVKVGDMVEAGDVISDGIPNPAKVVTYKGIGEGRRYFVNQFVSALKDMGVGVHRRNIEMLSRGLINYVKLTDEVGDYAPGDIVPYCVIAAEWEPRKDSVQADPSSCKGMYLEKPVLHYTIGTQLLPSVIKELKEYGVKQVVANKEAPPFAAEMVRGMAHAAMDPDWGTRMLGSYNKNSLLEAARRGDVSNAYGTSYLPAIAFGGSEFGHVGATRQTPLQRK